MIPSHPQFLDAIGGRRKVKVKFYSMADSGVIERICAPLDYGVGAGPADGLNRYWLWDYTNPAGTQILGLNPQQIVDLQVLGEEFHAEDFGVMTWPWAVAREWGMPPMAIPPRL